MNSPKKVGNHCTDWLNMQNKTKNSSQDLKWKLLGHVHGALIETNWKEKMSKMSKMSVVWFGCNNLNEPV